ncbi:zinc ion binding [Ascochyta rabiei]|uniref:Zinc ion binding n=1 Tax=Didymella rabiei TaxID=5454 RepID=A0A162W7U7_DIDRA|nr:zinc ion binding [Ascochyta rabiei]
MLDAQQKQEQVLRLKENLTKVSIYARVLQKHLPKRKTPITDFAKRYVDDAICGVISLNPVSGVLWRAVCNDREIPVHGELIASFGLQIEKIADADLKRHMKDWLEESYEYTLQRCWVHWTLCLSISASRVSSLIPRSTLHKWERNISTATVMMMNKEMTFRITYIESAADLPAHVTAMSNTDMPWIPMVLVSKEFEWKFWKISLHVILPGTVLLLVQPWFWQHQPSGWIEPFVQASMRSYAVLARQVEDSRSAEHRKQVGLGGESTSGDGLFLNIDRDRFTRLLDHQYAGANLTTKLTAELGWTPRKTQVSLGPLVMCRRCKFPRSITIMAERSGGKFGICIEALEFDTVQHRDRAIRTNVTMTDTASTKIAWAECSIRTCRAQYVCYKIVDLNVRPKCWYCRMQTKLLPEKRSNDPAPTVQCTECLSKVIWPQEWRQMLTRPFICTVCLDCVKSITDVDTSVGQICRENGQDWILQNECNALKKPFRRMLFGTITATGIYSFLKNARILPQLEPNRVFTLNGKQIRNVPTSVASFHS